MRLKLSPAAKEDIYKTHEFGALAFGTRQADLYVDHLMDTLARVEQFPEAARERDEVAPPIRLWPYASHSICYRIEGDIVWVVRILHHSMDWRTEV
ncbi:type II toxin-antitoxin system RelE/ParE family toxin [Devosia sp.]|jgi:toxin ParE1/3/4|uniref:type II toxin-antitoxin system RelE/ParE family toxin n=1 Tax=Devosia sp. TaxID=1871048 RepID=UPI0037C1076F